MAGLTEENRVAARKQVSAVHVADRLVQAVADMRAPVCVGIDPVLGRLPRSLRSAPSAADAIGRFSQSICDAVARHVPCVKFQSACFERYGSAGVAALESAVQHARRCGLIVILDAKRGDIGISAEHYAAAAFDIERNGTAAADWVTVNPYLGRDSIEPFLEHGGAFALVRTSNPSGDDMQRPFLADGHSVAEHVASEVARVGARFVGTLGYSALGAVVGATKRDEIAALRSLMPQQVFLVPGYGAQGGSVDDVLSCFNSDGQGAIITASRSVIYAFDEADPDWPTQVSDAAAGMADEIGSAVGLR